jgi:hypothetical protein
MPAADATMRLSDTIFPVSYRYWLDTPYGLTMQELTVDLPDYGATPEVASELGPLLWQQTVAHATTSSVSLFLVEIMLWKGGLFPTVLPVSGVQGYRIGLSSPVEDCGALVFMSGHMDRQARKRFCVPGIPAGWASHGMLTTPGAEGLQELARGMFVGIAEEAAGSQFTWLNAWPGYFEDGMTPGQRVMFRHVRHVRVCQYTDPMPSQGSPVWP